MFPRQYLFARPRFTEYTIRFVINVLLVMLETRYGIYFNFMLHDHSHEIVRTNLPCVPSRARYLPSTLGTTDLLRDRRP